MFLSKMILEVRVKILQKGLFYYESGSEEILSKKVQKNNI